MMKSVILSVILAIVPLLSFSQKDLTVNNYPKVIKFGNDTVVAITLDQVDSLNVMYINYDQCVEERDTLESISNRKTELINEYERNNGLLKEQITDKNSIITEKDNIISQKDGQIADRDRTIKKLKTRNAIFASVGGTALVGFIVSLFLLTH